MRMILLAALLALSSPARAAFQKSVGGNTAEFLKFGAGARSLGLGEAYGPIAEGPEAIYWNPAGLAMTRSVEFSYSRAELNSFFHHDYLAVAAPAKVLHGALGASYTRLSQEALTLVTNTNQNAGVYVPHSDAVSLAYAASFDLDSDATAERDYFGEAWTAPNTMRLPRSTRDEPWRGRLMVGLAVKAVNETIYQRSAHAVAFDGGALFRPADFQSFCLSFAFRNAGGKERFLEESESLPAEADLGLAWEARSWKARWLVSGEAALPYYGSPYAKAGVEYTRPFAEKATFSLRGGYKMQTVYDLNPMAGITFGLGARVSRFAVDFGFQPAAELGQVYRISVGVKW